MTEYIYYAKPKGAPDYMEEIVLETVTPLTPEMIEKIISCGLPNGLERRKEYLELNLRYVVPFLEVK